MQYRQVYSSPSFSPLLPRLPFYHVTDDHDIINDYDLGEHTSIYKNASKAFHLYQGNVNPSPMRRDVNYFSMDYGDTSFFFLDTRRYRSLNLAPDNENKTMLGKQQLQDLLAWLKRCEDNQVVWKFIISSVPMTKNWGGQKDIWTSFQYERNIILAAINLTSNVVIISGDRHEAAITALPASALEVSVSPLNQFYFPIPSYASTETDKAVAYLPDGQHKYAIYTVDTTNIEQPLLDVELQINGQTAWRHVFEGRRPGRISPLEMGKSVVQRFLRGWSGT
jgi:alkaline phosphatase D